MNNIPIVSIVTPCYNAEIFINKCIESVLAQTFIHWEMIIVDDFSNDNSLEIIKKYSNFDNRIIFIRNQNNMGAAQSRNIATQRSLGRYIAFLDSDDTWYKNKLERQISLMNEKNSALSYTAYYTMDDQDKKLALHPVKGEVGYIDLLKYPSIIGTLTLVYDTQKIGKYFFENIGHEDYVLKLKILKRIGIAVGILEPLAAYRVHDNSLSSNKIQALQWVWNIYRNKEKLSVLKSFFYFVHYVVYSFTKYKKL
ncbi:MAG: Putative N-acetylgalactosaminyl-diphosphoundecaprenol glucuronosyltransferase [uncultured Sulfurovum sp.]|uniref:N-acetylgalactosaminyl-diphosphoundecaprenol glucuronosyltransferase n=1 Tax=uncultured Sulfurovum sp. TaxID=269237 RepID=A0A6S6T863_9BACT|nr:MAG: Putative N-acetylgalactosaminyl-diphosphoundecaprenol glucuronosyltransferase [uncultured Sulfurovum sp.]